LRRRRCFLGLPGYFFPALKQANAAVLGSGAFRCAWARANWWLGIDCGVHRLNCLGVGRTAKEQNVLTSTKLIVIVASCSPDSRLAAGTGATFREHAVRTSTLTLPAQFIVQPVWVMVGYSGWNAAPTWRKRCGGRNTLAPPSPPAA